MRQIRITTIATGALIAALATLVACGGGGPASTPPAVTQPTVPQGPSVTIPLSHSGSVALPATGGINTTVTLSRNNAPPGTTLSIAESISSPRSVPSVPAQNVSTFEFFTLVPSADVTFENFPKFAMTFSSAPKTAGQYYAWMYDATSAAWSDGGSVTVSGSTMAFGGGARITLHAGVTYAIVTFTARQGAVCPIACTTPPPVPSAAPTPPGTKIFVSDDCFKTGPYIAVYDQNGVFVPVKGFNGAAGSIAFDSLNQQLYIASGSTSPAIGAFGLSGNNIPTTGAFTGIGGSGVSGIAFDPLNRQLYVIFGAANAVRVYDENGNTISTTGTFAGLNSPSAIAFDSANRRIYITNAANNTISVFDENGNAVSTSGTFPGIVLPVAIAFDSSNGHLYVANGSDVMTVYDGDGNEVASFPLPAFIVQLAFDASNHHLYGGSAASSLSNGAIFVFDESGNPVAAGGGFPFTNSPAGIAAAP